MSWFTSGKLYFTIKYSSSVVFNAMTNQDDGLHENGRKKTLARSTRTRETTFGILPISESMRLRESYSPRLAESVSSHERKNNVNSDRKLVRSSFRASLLLATSNTISSGYFTTHAVINIFAIFCNKFGRHKWMLQNQTKE